MKRTRAWIFDGIHGGNLNKDGMPNHATHRIGSIGRLPRGDGYVGAVEKVPEQISGRDAEKSDLTECARINHLMLGKGQVTPENYCLIPVRGFFYRLVSQ